MRSRLKAVSVGLALIVLLLTAATASAQTYTVTRTDDPAPGPCEPGDCSLREALAASNASAAVDDQIVLPASAVPYAVEFESKPLEATDSVEVKGAGADRVQVKGNGSNFILFVTGASPVVVLEGLTITGGKGGIQNNGDLTLRGVSIEGNDRVGGGGGIQSNGPLEIDSSFIGFNSATGASGGIHSNGAMTIVNSTIAHNSSESIGGVGGNSSVTISSSAVVFNTSTGADSSGVGGSPLTVRDSIFAGNENSAGTLNCFSFTTLTSLGGNVSDDGSCGTGATDKPNVNPLLGSLALHGGTTKVYDLLAGSPAIDAAAQCPATDQRGVARPQGAACDSGPYELVPAPLVIPPAVDREFFMKVGKKLRVVKRGVRVKLTCPRSEASPPCRGRVTLAGLPNRSGRLGTRLLIVRKKSARFTILAGKTKAVLLRLSPAVVELLPRRGKLKRGLLLVQAEDAAGNRWDLKKKQPLMVAKRG